jgi:hypothetical protein
MNPDLLQVSLPYVQQELARSRGHRNWVSLFRGKAAK